MNPLLLKTIFDIGSKLIDKKKVASATNATTVAGVGTGVAGYMFLVQSEDPVLQIIGALVIAASAIMTIYKSKEPPKVSRQVKNQAKNKAIKKAMKAKK